MALSPGKRRVLVTASRSMKTRGQVKIGYSPDDIFYFTQSGVGT
jgi:hypothetical protein